MPTYMGGFVCKECAGLGIKEDHMLIINVRYMEAKRYIRRRRECPRGHRLTTREYATGDLDAIYGKHMGFYFKVMNLLKALIGEITSIVGDNAIRNWKAKIKKEG